MAAYMLNRILFDLNRRSDRPEVLKNLEAHLKAFALEDEERKALLDRNFKALLALGALPNLVFKYYLWQGLPPGEYGQRVGGQQS
jgi:aromatic-ring opening dioxygenase LigAB LigA subunit